VNASAPRLYMSRDQAASLLDAQIRTGEELRQAVARATAVPELHRLKRRLSAWSARNERVLSQIFGEPERLAYRQASPPAVKARSLKDQQVHVMSRSGARLQYLREAAVTIGMAEDSADCPMSAGAAGRSGLGSAREPAHAAAGRDEQPGKAWRRAVLTSPWTIAVVAPLIVATIFAVRNHVSGRGSFIITGSVVCESGRPVAGVWIAASTGQRDSGFAHLGPLNPGSSAPAGPAATYSYRLPHGGTYSVHVGCGGTSAHWASSSYSPSLSGQTAHLRCDDPVASPTRRPIPRGTCATAPALSSVSSAPERPAPSSMEIDFR